MKIIYQVNCVLYHVSDWKAGWQITCTLSWVNYWTEFCLCMMKILSISVMATKADEEMLILSIFSINITFEMWIDGSVVWHRCVCTTHDLKWIAGLPYDDWSLTYYFTVNIYMLTELMKTTSFMWNAETYCYYKYKQLKESNLSTSIYF